MKRFDTKSALLGLAAGVLLTFALGAAASGGGQIGRFQVAGTASQAVIIDTATGKAWTAFLSQNAGQTDPEFKVPKQQQ